MTSMSDLPRELVGQSILTRVPITSLRAVRSTCKLWDALTKECVLGKAAAAGNQLFLGFMTKDSKVCSVRYHLCRSKDMKGGEDLLDLSIKQVDWLNQVKISRVFHCNGLLLCVVKDNTKLVVWNPYLGQTKCIYRQITERNADCYALGYDINHNHKILSFSKYCERQGDRYVKRYQMYDFSSSSWRVLNITSDWGIAHFQRGVSLKGNTYFYVRESRRNEDGMIEIEDFLLCFDFTIERFGLRLPLPFHASSEDTVSISYVRGERLAVLHKHKGILSNIVQIWVTTKIESNYVSWSKYLKPFALSGIMWFNKYETGSFFIDEEEKVAVIFGVDIYQLTGTETVCYHAAFIIGEDGYFKSVSLGVAPKVTVNYCLPRVCFSSYLQSLVQVN